VFNSFFFLYRIKTKLKKSFMILQRKENNHFHLVEDATSLTQEEAP